jgi:uncharacterized repeat protein (TIGR01451 family)
VTIANNIIRDNTTNYYGGGIYLSRDGNEIKLYNNIIADISAYEGGAIFATGSDDTPIIGTLINNTMANNQGDEIHLHSGAEMKLTNNLFVGYMGTDLRTDQATAMITATYTLWDGSGTYTDAGSGHISTTHDFIGDPKFDENYHLLFGSDAIDAGIATTVTTDVDGEPRDWDGMPDIGADEFTILLSPGATANADTEAVVNYTHILTYHGDGVHTFDITYENSRGWPVTYTSPITMSNDSTRTLVISVTAPTGTGGLTSVTSVTVTSQVFPEVSPSAQNTLNVNHHPGVAFGTDIADGTDPGTEITYTHTITNTGDGPDTFDITHASHLGWTTEYETPLTLGYGEARTLLITVTVPQEVVSDTVETTYITVTSQSDRNVASSLADTTTVWGPIFKSKLIASPSTIAHYDTLTFTLVLTNIGRGVAEDTILYAPLPTGTTFIAGSAWASSGPVTPCVDGTLSAWSVLSETLNMGRTGHPAVRTGDAIFVLGGGDWWMSSTSREYYTVEHALIDPTTPLGPWQVQAGQMNKARHMFAAVETGQYIYALGGGYTTESGLYVHTTNERTPIQAENTLGPWTLVSGLNHYRLRHTVARHDNHVYVLGGIVANGVYSRTVERAEIEGNGTLSSWVDESNRITFDRWNPAAVSVGDYLYLIGGWRAEDESLSNIERALINADGTLGSWSVYNAMHYKRYAPAAVVANNYVYVIGGWQHSGVGNIGPVEMAQINPDGSLENWQLTSALVRPRYGLSAITDERYIYAISGDSTVQSSDPTIERACYNCIHWRGDLGGGEQFTLTYQITVGDSFSHNDWITQTVEGVNIYRDVHVNSVTATVSHIPNLSSSYKTASTSVITAGNRLTYTIFLQNTGTGIADAAITDTLSSDVVYVPESATWTKGLLTDTDAIQWRGVIERGEKVTVTFAVTVATPITNNAKITNVALIYDGFQDHLTKTSTTTVRSTPQLNFRKLVTPTLTGPNTFITYTLILTNIGTMNASGVIFTDSIPVHTSYFSGGTYISTTNVVSFALDSLIVNVPQSFSFTVQTSQDLEVGDIITNVSYVFGDQISPQASNIVTTTGLDDIAPSFVDNTTPTSVATGDPLTFSVGVTDNVGVQAVYVTYWYAGGDPVTATLTGEHHTYAHTIIVSDTLNPLYYRFIAQDTEGNLANTSSYSLTIRDEIPPVFGNDTTPTSVATGDPLTFSVGVTDNVGVQAVYVTYWYAGGGPVTATLTGEHHTYAHTIIVSDTLNPLYYRFIAQDTEGNLANTSSYSLTIRDEIPPVFGNDATPTSVATGDPLTFSVGVTDNVGVQAVYVTYWYAGSIPVTSTLVGSGGFYTLTIVISNTFSPLYYRFFAYDDTGNSTTTETYNVIPYSACTALNGVNINGLIQVTPGLHTFEAIITPTQATIPITYTWEWGDNTPATVRSASTATHAYTQEGFYTITLTVTNCGGGVVTQFPLTITTEAADLSTSAKYVSHKAVWPGDQITYTIFLRNTGNSIAKNVSVFDPIPLHTTYVHGSLTSSATFNSSLERIEWLGQIYPSEVVTITFRVKVDEYLSTEPSIENIVTVNYNGQTWDLPPVQTLTSMDLFATGYDIFSIPQTVREGMDNVNLAVNVYNVSAHTVHDVRVEFYHGETLIGNGNASFISPYKHTLVQMNGAWDISGLRGANHIRVVVDPENMFSELSEVNNVATRTVAILPLAADLFPPEVISLEINNEDEISYSRDVFLDIEAHDAGGEVDKMFIIELGFNHNIRQWMEIQRSGWLTFTEHYTWTMSGQIGIRYIQVWVADTRGNISNYPGYNMINYMPPLEHVGKGRWNLYRHTVQSGQNLAIQLIPETGDPDLYVWGPGNNGFPDAYSRRSGKERDEVSLVMPTSGICQIQVYGFEDSDYRISIIRGMSKNLVQTLTLYSAENKTLPGIPLSTEDPPSRVGIPSAPVEECVLAESINITGPLNAVKGTVISFKAIYTPTNATDVALLWDNGDATSITIRTLDVGTHTLTVTATNCSAALVTDTHAITISAAPVCTDVTSVYLSQLTVGTIYTDTEVAFEADIAPDDAAKPYTYTIDYGDGISSTATSNDDPLTGITHTFAATGSYDVEIAVWNCEMSEPATDTVEVMVSEYGTCVDLTDIAIKGDRMGYSSTYTFTTTYSPSNATLPISYTWDNGDITSTTVRTLDVGTHTLAVTATNCSDVLVTDTYTTTIMSSHNIYLPLVLKKH